MASNDLLSVTCVRQKSSTVSVVLLKDHEGLGVKGEEKHVKPGFMRNFLYPSGVATYGIPENIAKFKTVFEVRIERSDAGAFCLRCIHLFCTRI